MDSSSYGREVCRSGENDWLNVAQSSLQRAEFVKRIGPSMIAPDANTDADAHERERESQAQAQAATTSAAQKAASVRKELIKCKELFSKLKFNFLELDTKQSFLQDIANGNVLDSMSESAVQRLEGESEHCKAQLKNVKADVKRLEKEISELADSLCRDWHLSQIKLSSAKETWAVRMRDVERRQATALKIEDATACEAVAIGVLDSEERCNEVLRSQLETIEGLNQAIEELRAQLEQTNWKIEPLQLQVESLKTEGSSLPSLDVKPSLAINNMKTRNKKIAAWENLITSLSGVKLKSVESDFTSFTLQLTEGSDLSIQVDPVSNKIRNAILLPPGPSIEDIVLWAQSDASERGGVSVLVSEVRARLRSLVLSRQQRDALKQSYVCTEQRNSIIVTLPVGVLCTLGLECETQALSPVILRLDSLNEITDESLELLRREMNESAGGSLPTDLVQFVALLEKRLEAVANERRQQPHKSEPAPSAANTPMIEEKDEERDCEGSARETNTRRGEAMQDDRDV